MSSVPPSRSISVDLAPSVRTVKPEPRGPPTRGDKSKLSAKSESVAGIGFADNTTQCPKIEEVKDETEKDDKVDGQEQHSAPPPTPDVARSKSSEKNYSKPAVITTYSTS